MERATPHTRGRRATSELEVQWEPELGVNLRTGEGWQGWRIRYRPLGSKGRWSSFLLESDVEIDDESIDVVIAKWLELRR